jgi:hypothetical protein
MPQLSEHVVGAYTPGVLPLRLSLFLCGILT